MAFDFDTIFKKALSAGVNAAIDGGEEAVAWLRESAQANELTTRAIADGVRRKKISKASASSLLQECARAMQSEAAALDAVIQGAAQAAAKAFMDALVGGLSKALKLVV
jgi:hypothetical protein